MWNKTCKDKTHMKLAGSEVDRRKEKGMDISALENWFNKNKCMFMIIARKFIWQNNQRN